MGVFCCGCGSRRGVHRNVSGLLSRYSEKSGLFSVGNERGSTSVYY